MNSVPTMPADGRMWSQKRLGDIPFARLLAPSIKEDTSIATAAQALDALLQKNTQAIPNLLIWARLDKEAERLIPPLARLAEAAGGLKALSPGLLELLAWQLHVDFREVARTDTQLAEMIVQSIPWHRIKGTPRSIIKALALFNYHAAIEEDGTGDHWATYQLSLPQIADIPTVQKILSIAKEMQPARCRLWRIYTDAFDRRPVIWSGGTRHDRWSDGWWTYYSGVDVPAGPDDDSDVVVSFGTRNAYQSEAYNPGDACGSFGITSHYGFLAPYLDRPIWSRSAWGDVYPQNHGFAIGSLFSILWADRATTGRRWRGFWDARSWLDYTGFDRKLPPWRMGLRAFSRSQAVFSEGHVFAESNACYSRPTAVILDAPPVWGAGRWSNDAPARQLLKLDELFQESQSLATPPVSPAPHPLVGFASCLSVSSPLQKAARVGLALHSKMSLRLNLNINNSAQIGITQLMPLLCQAVKPSPYWPVRIRSYRMPMWAGAWTVPGRTWLTAQEIPNT